MVVSSENVSKGISSSFGRKVFIIVLSTKKINACQICPQVKIDRIEDFYTTEA